MRLDRTPVEGFSRPSSYRADVPARCLAAWTQHPLAAEADEANTISIYDVIGEDWWSGGGFTAQRMAAALRSIGSNPVTVNINSPGGDMFEGLAIYNLLVEHPGEVTVKIMGIAASAASIIAMAADKVLMGTGTMLMVHHAWGLAIGNYHDFTESADLFKKFDESMASIYMQRTGMSHDEIFSLLDGPNKSSDGTFLTVAESIDKGFADGKFDKRDESSASAALPTSIMAKRRACAAMAAQGLSRKEQREILNAIQGTQDAASTATQDAGEPSEAEAGAESLAAIKAAFSSNLSILRG